MRPETSRRLLAGGVVGPVAFAGAWVWGSLTTEGYSMVGQPISRLAALGAPSRPEMTAGLLVFAGAVGAYAAALRHELQPAGAWTGGRAGRSGRAWVAAAVTAAGSVAIAATPLEGPLGGNAHAGAAGVAYASLVALQLTGARPLAEQLVRSGPAGARPLAEQLGTSGPAGGPPLAGRSTVPGVVPASRAMAAVSAVCLAGNAFGPESVTGLFQRVGLTTGHVWIAASAVALRRRA